MHRTRCHWLPAGCDLYRRYHDEEWGVPSRDRRHLFEMICLEGAQAGLSWVTILRKRERYREVFHHFDPDRVAAMGDDELAALRTDAGIVRHRGKIESVRRNARAWLALESTGVDVPEWLWSFAGTPRDAAATPRTTSPESDALAKALRAAGFGFVGSTTIHAFMQAVGMVNDHDPNCFRRAGVSKG